MNKKKVSIFGWALGLSMALAGVGVAVGASQGKAIEAQAATVTYEKVSSLTAGDQVLITTAKSGTNYYLPTSNGSSSAPSASTVTISSNKIVGNYDAHLFTVEASSTNWKFKNGTNYLYVTAANNGVRVGSNSNNVFTLTTKTNGFAMKETVTNRYLGIYATQDWRSYTSSDHSNYGGKGGSGESINFYKKVVSTPVESISLEGVDNGICTPEVTPEGENVYSMNIPSDETYGHSVKLTLNPLNATDQKVNISDLGGTASFDFAADHLDCTNGTATFSIAGLGATGGDRTYRFTANTETDVHVDLIVRATNSEVTYRTISMNVDGYTLQGEKTIEDGGNASLTLVAGTKLVLPEAITVNGVFTSRTYDNTTGAITISGLQSDVEITFASAPAPVASLALAGQKTSFKLGDAFSVGNLVVTATYGDAAATQEVVTEYGVDSSKFDSSKAGSYEITISFEGAVAKYNVTVIKEVIIPAGVDTINKALTGMSGTTYDNWTNKTDVSGAVYAGNSAADHDSVQLRSSSNAGIVTTGSAGFARKVVLAWNSNTAAGRTVDIYGKPTAYSSSADLYQTAAQGTKLGSIVNGTSTELAITGDYEFIGLRSNSGALYLDKIEITWEKQAAATDVAVVDGFIEDNMHLDHTTNDGSCQAWYNDMKKAFIALTDAQKEIILKSESNYGVVAEKTWKYIEVAERIAAWAIANGDSFNTETGAFALSLDGALNVRSARSEKTTLPLILGIVGVGTLAIGALFLLKKRRKEN